EPVEREVGLLVQDLKLALTTAEPPLLQAGGAGVFELTVRNEGGEVIRQARLATGLPPGLAFVLASDRGGYDPAAHTLSWDLGDLQPGEGRTVLWKALAREA